ncbi:DnaD domain protein [Paenibacillus sp.]|uniref:DnaD domain protein n=1 Tax=Paenibacillus sp. TaxID=58172 RepID=UPI002D6232E3|nr:DnaD domain protein [Paenibacillus sp.]HZG83863.1 DnaD domain protein [Paenibacillus sp.]
MAWLESHQELGRHPKTKKLARLLGVSVPAAVGHLHFLWWWALDYAQDGDLSRFDNEDIADACGWEGEASTMVRGLVDAGFIESDMQIHDWEEYAGRLVEKREQNKERKRKSRARHAPVTEDGNARHGATVPNQTEPNHITTATAPAHEPVSEPPLVTDESEEPIGGGYKTINDAHTKVFGTLTISPLFHDFYRSILNRGNSTEYVIELLYEVGSHATKPSLEYMQKVDRSWQEQGIRSRAEARSKNEQRTGSRGARGSRQADQAQKLREMQEQFAREETNAESGSGPPV